MNRIFKLFCVSVAVASTLTTAAMAQWSIGQPGSREPPPGLNRYVYMVMSDPLPGREFDFNDGYQNMQMAIWCSSPAGPERSVSDLCLKSCRAFYRRGNLIIWDQEGADLDKLRSDANAAIAGGKSRLIPGFDYGPDGAVSATYQVIGARMTRRDGVTNNAGLPQRPPRRQQVIAHDAADKKLLISAVYPGAFR